MGAPDRDDASLAGVISILEAIEAQIASSPEGGAATAYWLREILNDHPHPIVRHEAAFVLGRLRAVNIAHEEHADALCVAALYDSSPVVRHEAAEALWSFDAATVESTLQRLLQDSNADVSSTAALSLARRAQRLGCDQG